MDFNNKHTGTKDLIPWDDDGDSGNTMESLDEISTNGGGGGITNGGWDSSAMFQYNEKKYSINTTYKEDMSDYT